MCPPKDDLGVEFDEEVEQAIKDPKSGTLKKVLDYYFRRKEAEKDKLIAEEKKKKTDKPFWEL